MKTLTISMKTPTEALKNFLRDYKAIKKRSVIGSHFEISFDNKKDFDRFVKNLGILSQILISKPKSVYELAKLVNMDLSNLNKIILFFEELGAIRIKKKKIKGRFVKTPTVEYDKIEFPLKTGYCH